MTTEKRINDSFEKALERDRMKYSVRLHKFDGKSNVDIAKTLGISEANVNDILKEN